MKQHTYVACPSCGHWSQETRQGSVCKYCNNTQLVINPQERLCNMCGECLCPHEEKLSGKWISEFPHGLVDATVDGGYESYHLFDMSTYKFSMCEKCLRVLFNQFKIPPSVNDKMEGEADEETWGRDQKAYEYRVWKDAGKHHEAYMNRRCNAVQDCPNRAEWTIRISGNFTEDCACDEHKDARHNCMNCTKVKFIPNVLKPFL